MRLSVDLGGRREAYMAGRGEKRGRDWTGRFGRVLRGVWGGKGREIGGKGTKE